jgi:zinc transport system permease protein
MFDALTYPFMQRALAAGVLVGGLASYYGVFVVQRRLSFLGVGLAHAAFGGVALGLLVGAEPLAVAAPFTVATALAIHVTSARGAVSGDTAVGIFFAVAIALGVVFLALRQTYAADAFAYLFGSILAVEALDLWLMGALALLTVALAPLWGRWAYATFDRDLARADGLPVARDDALLVVLVACTVVAAVKLVGAVLVAAFLVIPAATARLGAASFGGMTQAAVALGVSGAVVGLAVSYALDWPSGATIILVQAAVFFTAFAATRGGG